MQSRVEDTKYNINYIKSYLNDFFEDDELLVALVYGSQSHKRLTNSNSDLDMMFVVKDGFKRSKKNKLIREYCKMSEFLGLPLDTEVPYENKLIVTTSEVASALKGRQFWDNKSVSIPSIEHTEEFLNSVNVKYRLILSAFTTVPYLIEGDIKLIKSIEELAFLRLIKLFEAITDKHAFLIEELVNFLVTDGDVSGKDYLGYKSNDINIEAYRAFINGQLTNLHESVELTSGHFKIESLNKLFDEKYQEFLSLGGKEQYV